MYNNLIVAAMLQCLNALTLKSKPRKLKISFIDRKKPEGLDVASCYLALAILQNKRNSPSFVQGCKTWFSNNRLQLLISWKFSNSLLEKNYIIYISICLFINTFNPFAIKSSEFIIISNENTRLHISINQYYSTIRIKFRKHVKFNKSIIKINNLSIEI